jgi:hypothetical protein
VLSVIATTSGQQCPRRPQNPKEIIGPQGTDLLGQGTWIAFEARRKTHSGTNNNKQKAKQNRRASENNVFQVSH